MKKLIPFLLLLLSVNSIHAQWSIVTTPTTDPFTCVAVPGHDTAYAVTSIFGNGGKIFGTKNGTIWTQQATNASYLLTVFFRNTSLGWAGGGVMPNGIILKTTDGGVTWNTINTSVYQIYSIYFTNDTIGYAIGNDPTAGTYHLYKSTDGGNNWTQTQTGFDYLRSIWFTSDSIGYCAGDNGRIFKTTNAGLNWTLLLTGVVFHFNDQCFINDSIGWSNGQYVNGRCYKTTDAGTTWVPLVNPTNTVMTSLSFTDNNNGWQVGDSGKIFHTVNGGNSWTLQPSHTLGNLSCVRMYDNSNGFAVGYIPAVGGVILRYESSSVSLNETSITALQAWPNPAHDRLHIEIPSGEALSYQLTDLQGRQISTGIFSETNAFVDISKLNAGIYLLHFLSGGYPPIRFIKD